LIPADGPYPSSDPAAIDRRAFPPVFNGVVGPYSIIRSSSSSSSSGSSSGGGSSSKPWLTDRRPEFTFGWVPVSMDEFPEEEFDEAWQQPKIWNYRCYKACKRWVGYCYLVWAGSWSYY
jgi:hypothetical protein